VEARITVLFPVRAYHRPYLERAVACVLGQSSPRWRLLVIDDGAKGRDFREVIAPALADGRARLVESQGRGLAGALNTGLRHATTDYAATLFGDDLWPLEAVETLTSYIERFPEVDLFHSSRLFVDEEDRPISSVRQARKSFTLDDFVSGSPVKHTICVRREAALAIGGIDETLDSVGADDYDFPWSMAEAGARFMAVSECLYLARDHRDSYRLTTHLPLSVHERALARMFRKHGVEETEAVRVIAKARQTYLRQCLYRSRADRLLKRMVRHDARTGWREPYE
jgi:glycosyltransferase involved in cell wall biosynthesis